jgi:hypothetical protein
VAVLNFTVCVEISPLRHTYELEDIAPGSKCVGANTADYLSKERVADMILAVRSIHTDDEAT